MKQSLNTVVAANIRRLRQTAGHSQEEFAEVCGLHRTYIGAIERGERNITLKTLERIAGALKVNVISLLKKGED